MSKVIRCDFCGEIIPAEKLAKRSGEAAKAHHFCDRAHGDAWRQEHGEFARIGAAGNAAQSAYKAEHGKLPAGERRAAAVAESNKKKPRRRKA